MAEVVADAGEKVILTLTLRGTLTTNLLQLYFCLLVDDRVCKLKRTVMIGGSHEAKI